MEKPSADVSRVLDALVDVKSAMLAFEDYEAIDPEGASGFNWQWLKDKVNTARDLLDVAKHLDAYVSPSIQREAKAFLEEDIGAAYHLDTGHGTIGPPSREEIKSVNSLIVKFQNASDRAASKESGGGKRTNSPRRGRRPKYDKVKDEKLVNDWKAASDQGTSKPEFARSKGVSTKELEKTLARVRSRKRRAN